MPRKRRSLNPRDPDGCCLACGLMLSDDELDDRATHECPDGFEMTRKLLSQPRWVRDHIQSLEDQICGLEALKKMHALLGANKNWYVIGPLKMESDEDYRTLWILEKNQPVAICSLGRGDRLFVGRG